MQQAYRRFSAYREQGRPDYESLEMGRREPLTLDAGHQAEKVLKRVLNDAINSPDFLKQSGGKEPYLRTQLKIASRSAARRATTRRSWMKPSRWWTSSSLSIRCTLRPLIEKGMLLEAMARTARASRKRSGRLRHWEDLAQELPGDPGQQPTSTPGIMRRMPPTAKKTTKARQILGGIMRLNPSVGGPEMKVKYQAAHGKSLNSAGTQSGLKNMSKQQSESVCTRLLVRGCRGDARTSERGGTPVVAARHRA